MATFMSVGFKGVPGVQPVKPFSPKPPGKIRIRMRQDEFATAFVRTADGLKKFIIQDDGETWSLGFEMAENRRIANPEEPTRLPGTHFLAVVRIGQTYRSPRRWEEAAGLKFDEVWLFGDYNHVPGDKELYKVLVSAARFTQAIIYWMPLPRPGKGRQPHSQTPFPTPR